MKLPAEIAIAIVQGVVQIARLIFRPKKKFKQTKSKTKEVQTFETTVNDPETLDNTIEKKK